MNTVPVVASVEEEGVIGDSRATVLRGIIEVVLLVKQPNQLELGERVAPVVIISGAKMVTEILSITVSEAEMEVMNGPHMEPPGEETPERGGSLDLKMLWCSQGQNSIKLALLGGMSKQALALDSVNLE